jgi:hypothetical protein
MAYDGFEEGDRVRANERIARLGTANDLAKETLERVYCKRGFVCKEKTGHS